MKYDVNEYSDVLTETSSNEIDITLSKDSSSLFFQMFTKNIYSNPIGSIVREITSNCFDSHVEANVKLPVLIRKNVDVSTNSISISFIDYGVGMSPKRISDVFSVMLSSSKRDDNDQIGCFGLGSKVPLAYKRNTGHGEADFDNSYWIITNYDSIKYVYMIYDGNKSPKITLQHQEPTTDGNGTEVRIPVLERDLDTFKSEMTKQLYYFENIIFEGFEYEHSYNKNDDGTPVIISPMDNDYQIVRGKSFLFRGDDYKTNIHVCLGRVAYPIDYPTLGLSSSDYRLPIALRLEVGDIGVTVSRESLDYSEKTIKLLKVKLEEAKAEITGLITKQYENIKTLEQYFSVKTDFGKLEFSNGASLYVGELVKQSDIDFSNFKYQFTKMPNDRKLFNFFFEKTQMGKKPRRSRYSSSNSGFIGGYNTIKKNDNLLYVDEEFKRKIVKQAYLKHRFESYYIVSKRSIDGSWMRAEIADLFNVHLDSMTTETDKPVKFVKELLAMQEEYMKIIRKNCEDYTTLDVPQDFIDARKRGSGITSELRKLTIPVKFIGGYSKERVKLSVLFDYNMPIFYGTIDDELALNDAKDLFQLLFDDRKIISHCSYNDELVGNTSRRTDDSKNKSSIAIIQLAKGNVKHMEHCKTAYHISEFSWRILRRKTSIVEQYLMTNDIIEKFDSLNKFYREGYINKVSADWGTKITEISQFIDAIPTNAKNANIKYQQSKFERYIKLNVLKPSQKQVEIIKAIEEVVVLQETNKKTVEFFNIPWEVDTFTDEQALIMELSLTL